MDQRKYVICTVGGRTGSHYLFFILSVFGLMCEEDYCVFRNTESFSIDDSDVHRYKYIYLTRLDIVRQAISSVMANQSRVFVATPENLGSLRKHRNFKYTYEFKAISDDITAFKRNKELWDVLFKSKGIEPLHITFEGMVSDPFGTAKAISEYIGVTLTDVSEHDFLTSEHRTIGLSGGLTDRWVSMYERDLEHERC